MVSSTEEMAEKALFDSAEYADPLALAGVDGQGFDKIRLQFAGCVDLDRSDPTSVELFRRLKLGQAFELRVEGTAVSTAARAKLADDGYVEVVTGTKTVKITSVHVLEAEEL